MGRAILTTLLLWHAAAGEYHQKTSPRSNIAATDFLSNLFQVEAPSAYVCAGGKVYDATEWYICQVNSLLMFMLLLTIVICSKPW